MTDRTTRAQCILVAEDEALVAMELEGMLQRSGFDVACFASGEDARAWLEEHTATAAVLDIKLREGTCVRLASDLKTRGIPFVVYSGLPQQEAQSSPPLGDAPFLSKPADADQIVPRLVALIAEHHGT